MRVLPCCFLCTLKKDTLPRSWFSPVWLAVYGGQLSSVDRQTGRIVAMVVMCSLLLSVGLDSAAVGGRMLGDVLRQRRPDNLLITQAFRRLASIPAIGWQSSVKASNEPHPGCLVSA